ncbi:MAG: hypothetical protein WBP93_06125 [Pyrinomonadaceae bacterium]
MNCKNFENVINDLARNQMMDVMARESALEHAKDCTQCAARLADEETLTLGLRTLSMQSANVEAPAKVEAALLAAFRAPEKVFLLSAHPKQSAKSMGHLWKWAAAVAAAVVLAFSIFALNGSHWPKPSPGEKVAGAISPVNNSTTTLQPDKNVNEEVAVKDEPGVGSLNQAEMKKGLMQNASFKRDSSRRANRVDVVNRSNEGVRPVEPANNAGNAEVATDFMPLTYDAAVAPLDSGHLVRIELPRTALLSMGLPMSVERQNEYVKADVLMGEDGVARAIRFVR